jgi:hypothetical protein
LAPGGEALGVALRPTLVDQAQKQIPGNDLKYLAEQTCAKLHGRDSFEVIWRFSIAILLRESLCYRSACKPILDKYGKIR